MTPDVFAANRGTRLADVDKELLPVVTKALTHWKAKMDWYESIVEGASVLWSEMFEESVPDADKGEQEKLLAAFQKDLRATLAKTQDPKSANSDQAQVITEWVSTSTSNHAELRAARVNKHPALRWVTRHDDRVRSTHAAIDGTTVPAGSTFKVGDAHLAYPGEPVGDPSLWLRCRCLLQRVGEGKSMAGNTTAFTEEPVLLAAATPDDTDADIDATPVDVPTPTPFHGVAAPTDTPSGDGRQLAKGGFAVRPLPISMNYQRGSFHGGDPGPAVTVGRIDAMWLDDTTGLVNYSGTFSPNIPEADEAIQHVVDGTIHGTSVDLDATVMESIDWEDQSNIEAMDAGTFVTVFDQWRIAGLTMVAIPAFPEANIALGPHPAPPAPAVPMVPHPEAGDGIHDDDMVPASEADSYAASTETFGATSNPTTEDGPGWLTDPKDTQRLRSYWTKGEGAAKINWGVDGDFDRCRAELGKYVEPQYLAGTCSNLHKVATGAWPGHAPTEVAGLLAAGMKMAAAINLVASAAPEVPPGDWFQDPKLSAPTPLTVLESGRVFAHVALWETCHIGFDKVCTTAPSSSSNYAYYRTGEIDTTLGPVNVGQITMGAGHANMRADAATAAAHYDNVAHAVADVAAGEDEHGIWVAGSLRPGVHEDDVRALRAASLSGDWRRIRGGMEMVAALAVNVPGFPIPRNALAASGQDQLSLVAAGVVQEETQSTPTEDFDGRVALAVERVLSRRDRVSVVRERAALVARQARLARAKRIKEG